MTNIAFPRTIEFLPVEDPAWQAFPETIADITAVLAFDTETTGTGFEDDRIVTAHASIVHRDGSHGLDPNALDVIVNAGVEISDGAAAVHGVTNERRIAEGISERDAILQIAARLAHAINSGIPIVAFNGTFDFTMVDRALARQNLPPLPLERAVIIDPFVIDKAVDKYRKGKRQLTNVTEHYGVEFSNAHEASADAVAAARVLFVMSERLREVARMKLSRLGWSQQLAFQQQAQGLEEHFRRRGTLEAPLNKCWLVAPVPEPSVS